MPFRLTRLARGRALGAVCVALTVGALASQAPSVATTASLERGLSVRVTWTDEQPPREAQTLSQISARVDLGARANSVVVRVANARFETFPSACRRSSVIHRRSYLADNNTRLVCRFAAPRATLSFGVTVWGVKGQQVTGSVTATRSGASGTASIPARTITGTPSRSLTPSMRLLSSPDFLNGDVADLRRGPNNWSPRRSTNGINDQYRTALGKVLDDFKSLKPAAVLVAGDLVDGRWGYDDHHTGNFGPVTTNAQRRAAVRRAARTYYPQWKSRFAQRGLKVFPAMGDHEFGDNPWGRAKLGLASTFTAEFARAFTTRTDGSPRYPDHPNGPAQLTAYATRPAPDVQFISLQVFDINSSRARIGLDSQQLEWLTNVLEQAQRDDVKWIIVQGHVPIVTPVRTRSSSGLHYPGGTDSRLWKLFEQYDVDLYLCGEVHDTTAIKRDGVVQISHGGIFQFGLTTALVMDFYDDGLRLSLRDYNMTFADKGKRLWETRRAGLPNTIKVAGKPFTIGTAYLDGNGGASGSGILAMR